jgi:hypothetical protein
LGSRFRLTGCDFHQCPPETGPQRIASSTGSGRRSWSGLFDHIQRK